MDSKIKTGVPYSFTFIRELFGNNSQSMKNRKSSCHLATKRVNCFIGFISRGSWCSKLKPTKLIFNIENM